MAARLDFFAWHNDEHHHAGLALFTPADVFHGRVEVVRAARQSALDGAYREHPERFPHGPPRALVPPAEVHINPLVGDVVSVLCVSPTAIDASSTPDLQPAQQAAHATRAALRGATSTTPALAP